MAAKHDCELRPDAFTHLHLDAAHMGVGGDDSWSPSCHQVAESPMVQRGPCMPLHTPTAGPRMLTHAAFAVLRLPPMAACCACFLVSVKAASSQHCALGWQEYAVAPGQYAFSILLAPLLPSKEQTPAEAAARLWVDHQRQAA